MNTVQRLAKNTSILFISQILTYILGFFTIIYTARYLGAENFGILSLALALTTIFGVFTDLGLSTLIVREVARDHSLRNKYFINITLMKFILCTFTFGLLILFTKIIGYPLMICNVIYIIMLYVIIGSFITLFYSVFQAYEKMEYQSISIILNSCLMFIGVILAINYKFNIFMFALLYVITNLFILIYMVFNYKKHFQIEIEIDLKFWKKIIKKAWSMSLTSIFGTISFKVDTVILSIMVGNIVVGWYSASYKIMEVLLFLPIIYSTSIYPIFSKLHTSSDESLELAYKKSFKYLTLLGLPIALGITILAKKIIIFIYGMNYLPSTIALQILIWTIPLAFLTQIFGILLVSIDKQYLQMKIVFICMVFNILLNIIFIHYFSYIGASLITLLSELILFILCFHYISRFICKISILNLLKKPLTASMIMGLFILYAKINLIMVILIATILYLVILIVLKTFSKEDIEIIKRVLE